VIRGLLVGHAGFGEALLKALESISGVHEEIIPVSNEGLSTRDIADRIQDAARDSHDEGIIVFVDVFGGSCWRAAKSARIPMSRIITGFNLPMLLSFVNKRTILPFEELAEVMENDGKRGICSGEML